MNSGFLASLMLLLVAATATAADAGSCTGPSNILTAALTSPACAGQSVPSSISRGFTQAAKLIGQAASSSAKQKKRPLKKAKKLLKESEAKAAKAAKGKKAKVSSDCAATIKGAADCVLTDLGSCDPHCTGSCVPDSSGDITTPLIGTAHAGRNTEVVLDYAAGTLTTQERFVSDGSFYASGLPYPEGVSYNLPERNFTYTAHVDTVGSCIILTARETRLHIGPTDPPSDPHMTPLDIGPVGSVTNGQVTTSLGLLVEGTPQYPKRLYRDDGTLLDQGFDAGQTVTLSWPGGADLGPLSASNVIPPRIQLLSPMEALTDPHFSVNTNQPFTATWQPAGGACDTFHIQLANLYDAAVMNADGSIAGTLDRVVVNCSFPDAAGTGTIPADVMMRLASLPTGLTLDPNASLMFLYFIRAHRMLVHAPLLQIGGSGDIQLSWGTNVTRYGGAFFVTE